MAVRVVCDTTNYLPAELLEELAVEQVSLSVSFGDDHRPEIEMPDYDGFYADLKAMDLFPTTSQPSIGEFLAVYEPILEAGDDIVSLHLASVISGTYETALRARQQLIEQGYAGERIVVIDSERACGGLGLIVIAAARAAAKQRSTLETAAAALRMRDQMHMWFAVDTLEYLRKGGRIGAASAWVGTAMKIKPILQITGEGIQPIERVRTSKRALDRLIEMGRENLPADNPAFAVQHIQAPELANEIADRCRAAYNCEPVFISQVGPVIGSHVGPGLIGIAVVPGDLVT